MALPRAAHVHLCAAVMQPSSEVSGLRTSMKEIPLCRSAVLDVFVLSSTPCELRLQRAQRIEFEIMRTTGDLACLDRKTEDWGHLLIDVSPRKETAQQLTRLVGC